MHTTIAIIFRCYQGTRTLLYSKVSDVVFCMTEYCFFCGLHNPCYQRKTKVGTATDYYPDRVGNAMRGISLTSGKKLKYSISVVRQMPQSHRAEIDKPVSQAVCRYLACVASVSNRVLRERWSGC